MSNQISSEIWTTRIGSIANGGAKYSLKNRWPRGRLRLRFEQFAFPARIDFTAWFETECSMCDEIGSDGAATGTDIWRAIIRTVIVLAVGTDYHGLNQRIFRY